MVNSSKAQARIDHVIFGASKEMRDLLLSYEEIGFKVSPYDQTMRHQPGLRTGFLYFSPKGAGDYIEFLTVEDRGAFTLAQAKGEEKYTEQPCAQGVGIRVKNADAVHTALVAQGTAVKPVWSKRPEDKGEDTPNLWSFVELEKPLSGLGSFYVQYLQGKVADQVEIQTGANGIFAVAGLLYDSDDLDAVTTNLIADFPRDLVRREGSDIWLGCHRIFATSFKRFCSNSPKASFFQNPDLNFYGVHLYTQSLETTAAALKGKWKPHVVLDDRILLLPTEHEGLLAVVTQYPVTQWQNERVNTKDWLF